MELFKGKRPDVIGIWEMTSLVVSLLLFISAKSLNEPILAEFSAIVAGAALGTILSKLSLAEFIDSVTDIGCTSREEEISRFRRKLYLSYVTSKNGNEAWRCIIVDFSKYWIPKKLKTIVITEEGGRKFKYIVEGFVKRSRLVLYSEPVDSNEESAVCVFPFIGKEFEWANGPVSGIHIGETWDQRTLVSPALVTDNPEEFIGWDQDGFVSKEINKKLTSLWLESTKRLKGSYEISEIISLEYLKFISNES